MTCKLGILWRSMCPGALKSFLATKIPSTKSKQSSSNLWQRAPGEKGHTFEEFLVDCFSVRLRNEHFDTLAPEFKLLVNLVVRLIGVRCDCWSAHVRSKN